LNSAIANNLNVEAVVEVETEVEAKVEIEA
jgi:hypothetical protein